MRKIQKHPAIEDVRQSHIIEQETMEVFSADNTPHRNIITITV